MQRRFGMFDAIILIGVLALTIGALAQHALAVLACALTVVEDARPVALAAVGDVGEPIDVFVDVAIAVIISSVAVIILHRVGVVANEGGATLALIATRAAGSAQPGESGRRAVAVPGGIRLDLEGAAAAAG